MPKAIMPSMFEDTLFHSPNADAQDNAPKKTAQPHRYEMTLRPFSSTTIPSGIDARYIESRSLHGRFETDAPLTPEQMYQFDIIESPAGFETVKTGQRRIDGMNYSLYEMQEDGQLKIIEDPTGFHDSGTIVRCSCRYESLMPDTAQNRTAFISRKGYTLNTYPRH